MEAELISVIGAYPHRTAHRNGHRPRTITTTADELELETPGCAPGRSSLRCWNGGGRPVAARGGEGLYGTSIRKVDDLVKILSAGSGISKSEVSRICADLDTEVAAFGDRSLAQMALPYVFLDATCCKARVNHRVVSQAVVVASGAAADGHREVLGFDVGDSEDGAFWTAFLRSLQARGLAGVQLSSPTRLPGNTGPVAYPSAAGIPLGRLTVFPWMRSIHSAAASVSGWSGPSLRRRWGNISWNSPSAPA